MFKREISFKKHLSRCSKGLHLQPTSQYCLLEIITQLKCIELLPKRHLTHIRNAQDLYAVYSCIVD